MITREWRKIEFKKEPSSLEPRFQISEADYFTTAAPKNIELRCNKTPSRDRPSLWHREEYLDNGHE